jgi:hypothetical protein
VEFTLPPSPSGATWLQTIDTDNIEEPFTEKAPNGKVIVGGRSLMLFRDE